MCFLRGRNLVIKYYRNELPALIGAVVTPVPYSEFSSLNYGPATEYPGVIP